eukprot:scaffold369_cov177-Ochromonas_danica.AAC.35
MLIKRKTAFRRWKKLVEESPAVVDEVLLCWLVVLSAGADHREALLCAALALPSVSLTLSHRPHQSGEDIKNC